ncbi:MAG: amidase family protein [Vicinamibacterales bacterium]
MGLKAAYGELPASGVVPLSRTFDHVGPLASTVTDAWHILHVLRDRKPEAPLTPLPLDTLRLGVPRRYFLDRLDADVRRSFESAIDALQSAGATITDVDIPHARLIATVYLHIMFGDAAAYHADTLERVPEKYTENVRLRLEMARYVMAEDYVRALDGRRLLRREVDAALAHHEALILPTLPIVAPPLGVASMEIDGSEEPIRNLMLRLTQLVNVTGHPAITLPGAPAPSGLPCGIQLVGRHEGTDALLQVARTVEQLLA